MGGTHLFYNGVELRDCVTKVFDQKMLFDDGGNHVTSVFRIRVESMVYGFYNGAASTPYTQDDLLSHPSTVITKNTGETDTKGTATDRMGIIQRLLKEPRKDFFYATHGGKREDITEDIYQVMLAATGADKAGTLADPEFFKDVLGNDLQIRYIKYFNDNGPIEMPAVGQTNKISRVEVIDTNNGPRPIDCQVTEAFGGRAFRISFEIEVHRHLCYRQDSPSDTDEFPYNLLANQDALSNPYILSNTWSSEETCDEEFRRTRTVEGTLRVRDARYWSHAFRYLCIPGLLPGYQRKSQRFASDATNLTLKYRIEDKQAEASPPAPAVKWEMRHVDSSKNEFGMVERQLTIELTGLPKCPKDDLIAAAIRLLDERFPAMRVRADDFRVVGPVPGYVTAMIISQATSQPTIELMVNVRQHLAGLGGFEQAVEASATPPVIAGYDPDSWPAPKPFDSDTPAGIFACYAQRPCNPWHGMPKAQVLELEAYETENIVPDPPELGTGGGYWEQAGYAEYLASTPLASTPLGADELMNSVHVSDHINLPYQLLEVESKYVSDPGVITLPLSKLRTVQLTQAIGDTTRTMDRIQSCVNIAVHAGVMYREITVTGHRHGAPVEIPEPAVMLIDHNGVVETLAGAQTMVLDAPQTNQGQQYRVFSAQAKFRYVLDRPLLTTERFRMGNLTSLGTTPDDNSVSGLALFSRGRVEHHRTVIPSSGDAGVVYSEVVAPTITNTVTGPTVGKVNLA